MPIVVKRNRRRVYEAWEETAHEKWDSKWLNKYSLLLEFTKKFGHQRFPCDETSPNYKSEYAKLHKWAVNQRWYYRQGKLADWRYNMLIKAGFLFEPLETYWRTNYDNLVKFKIKSSHCNVSKFDSENLRLGKWIGEQRYHKKRLSPEKINLLDDLGFDWGIKRNKWDDMYEWLKNYHLENGVAYVQRDMSEGYSANELNRLNRWCCKQIWYYNRAMLSPDKCKLLQDINFDFNHKENIIKNNWDTNFRKLIQFQKEYGHFNVPIRWEKDRLLAFWVQRQRVYKNKLTDKQRQKLDAIGFSWSYIDDHWERNYEKLLNYIIENGHCKVFPSHDKKLYNWVHYMRKVKKGLLNFQLSEEQIGKLDEIGFVWEPHDTLWEERYAELKIYKNEHGHCRIKLNDDKRLYIWCRSQRYGKDKLDKDRIKRLNKIGFPWG